MAVHQVRSTTAPHDAAGVRQEDVRSHERVDGRDKYSTRQPREFRLKLLEFTPEGVDRDVGVRQQRNVATRIASRRRISTSLRTEVEVLPLPAHAKTR